MLVREYQKVLKSKKTTNIITQCKINQRLALLLGEGISFVWTVNILEKNFHLFFFFFAFIILFLWGDGNLRQGCSV